MKKLISLILIFLLLIILNSFSNNKDSSSQITISKNKLNILLKKLNNNKKILSELKDKLKQQTNPEKPIQKSDTKNNDAVIKNLKTKIITLSELLKKIKIDSINMRINYEKELKKYKTQSSELKSAGKGSVAELNELKNKNKILNSKNNSFLKTIKEINQKNIQFQKQIDTLTKNYTVANLIADNLKSKLDKLKSDNINLKESKQALQNVINNFNIEHNKISDFINKIINLKIQNKKLTNENKKLIKKISDFNNNIISLKSNIANLENENKQILAKNNEYLNKIKGLSDTSKSSIKNILQENIKLKKAIDELNRFKNDLITKLNSTDNKISDQNNYKTQKKIEIYQDLLEKLKNKYSKIESENKKLAEKIKSYAESEKEFDELNQKNNILIEQVNAYEKQNDNLKQQNKILAKTIESRKEIKSEDKIKRLITENIKLETKVQQLQNLNNSLIKRLAAKKNINGQTPGYISSNNSILQDNLKKLKKDYNNIISKIDIKNSNINNYLSELNLKNNELKKMLNTAIEKDNTSKIEVLTQVLLNNINSLNQKFNELIKNYNNLSNTNENKKNDLLGSKLGRELTEKEFIIKDLRDTNKSITYKMTRLLRQNHELVKKLNEHKELKLLEIKNNELTQLNGKLKETNLLLKTKIQNSAETINNRDKIIVQLQSHNKKLNIKNENLKELIKALQIKYANSNLNNLNNKNSYINALTKNLKQNTNNGYNSREIKLIDKLIKSEKERTILNNKLNNLIDIKFSDANKKFYSKKIAELKETNNNLKVNFAALKNKYDGLLKNINNNSNNSKSVVKNELIDRLNELVEKNQKLIKDNSILKLKNKKNTNMNILNKQIAGKIVKLESENISLMNANKKLSSKLVQISQQTGNSYSDLEMNSKIKELKNENKILREKSKKAIKELALELNRYKSGKNKSSYYPGQIKKLTDENKNLQKQNEKISQTIDKLKQDNLELSQTIEDINLFSDMSNIPNSNSQNQEKLTHKIEELTSTINEKNQTIRNLNKNLQELKVNTYTGNNNNKLNYAYQNQLNSLTAANKKLKQELVLLNDTLEIYKNKLSEIKQLYPNQKPAAYKPKYINKTQTNNNNNSEWILKGIDIIEENDNKLRSVDLTPDSSKEKSNSNGDNGDVENNQKETDTLILE